MILADTSVWVDHFAAPEPELMLGLSERRVLGHPLITGELAMGSLRDRSKTLRDLDDLPRANEASHTEVRRLVERYALFALGVGFVDVHLLASVMLTDEATLWTRDKRLRRVAQRFEVDAGLA